MFEEESERTQQCVEQQLQPAERAAPDIEPTESAVHQLTPVTPPRWSFSTTPAETACSYWGMNENILRSGPPQELKTVIYPHSAPHPPHRIKEQSSSHTITQQPLDGSAHVADITFWHEGISLMCVTKFDWEQKSSVQEEPMNWNSVLSGWNRTQHHMWEE